MEEAVEKLKVEIERVRSQLYVFYELTKAMRTTLRLDEITYIILTSLTAQQGLGFNRALIFFVDQEAKLIKGFMGIGPIDTKEAGEIWQNIETEKKGLYDLIANYHQIKESDQKPKFMEFAQLLTFPLAKESGLIFKILEKRNLLYIKKDQQAKYTGDPLVEKLKLEEFLIASLEIQNKPQGVILVDNYITKKAITKDEIKIFNMFLEEATGAIENSQSFESTLLKSHSDPLTSLWNYGYFQYKLDEELAKAESRNESLSVIMIDLDDFKKFNDLYGHIQGDKALQLIGQVLKENCRKIDILCRYGGEEFSLILPVNNKSEAVLLAERIRKSIADKEILNYKFTVSIGSSSFPQDASSKEILIQKADQALYQAKKEGKNKVVAA